VKIAVIGLGYVGLPLAMVFAEAGIEVVGVEAVAARCDEINAGRSYIQDVSSDALKLVVDKGLIRATTDYAATEDCDADIICLPTPLNANRELVATGAANLGGAFLGAMPAGGGTSQTAVVRSAGGQSQKASLVTAATALATMLLLAPILGLMPNATLAAVVIVYSVGLIQPAEFRAIRSVRSMEFRWALVACLGVLLFGTLKGIVVAIIVSMLGLAGQTAHPRVSVIGRKRGADVLRPVSAEHPDDETFEGLLIVRPEGRLFFVNAQYVSDRIRALVVEHKPKVVALDLSRVPDIEYSALLTLMEGEQRMTDAGMIVWLAGMNPGVLEVARHAGLDQRLGRERMLFNARAAIERYEALLAEGGKLPPTAAT